MESKNFFCSLRCKKKKEFRQYIYISNILWGVFVLDFFFIKKPTLSFLSVCLGFL